MQRHIGFTGTQIGMTWGQKITVRTVLEALRETGGFLQSVPIFHHGDCVGADAEAHELACAIGYQIEIHPPAIAEKRAFLSGLRVHMPLPYLARNRIIVESSQAMVATPKGQEELRSGTWSTIRYALKIKRPLWVIYPDGNFIMHGGAYIP